MTSGVAAGLGVLALAAAMGLIAARLVSPHYGLFCAGLVMAWGAWGTGTIDEVLRARPASFGAANKPMFTTLALEAAWVAPIGVLIAWGIIAIGKPPPAESPHHPEPKTIRDPSALAGLLAAMAVGGVIVWLIAQSTLKGQTFAAAALAGLGAAAAGRLSATRVSAAVFVAGLGVLAIASPVSALVMHGAGAQAAAQAGTLFRFARPLPLDWLAGAFVGVPLGLTWASSMLDQHRSK
jgi:hypothetical protein